MPPSVTPSAAASGSSDGLLIGDLRALRHVSGFHMPRDQVANQPLLLGDAPDGVDDVEAELVHDSIVLIENFALKQPEALHRVRAPAEIHAGFIELQLDPPRHQTIE